MGVDIALLAFLVSAVVYVVCRRNTRISLKHVRGPVAEASFLLGNLPELYQSEAAAADLKWQKAYGDVVRIKGVLGEDRLLIMDAKALQYIYQTSGLVWADGDAHKRQRKMKLPGFGNREARSFLPIFFSTANKLGEKWKDMISASGFNSSMVVNVPCWLSRATLDAIGEAAFD
ncbi:Cytochrome P450 superfamily protein [Pleurotus pulmonarius]